MSLTAVVEQRLEQGQTTAAGPYIELVDMDEVDQLNDAYLSLNDRKYGPEEQPPPLTSEQFKRYVRLAHDAIRSTNEAIDAFKEAKDGTMGKSSAMNYIDGLKMFEIQLIAGKLVKAVHKIHSGTVTTPSWPMITALKFHKYQTFTDRMDKVIIALRTWKSLGKALFLDMVSMEKRLAMQPEEETKKKGTNKSNNGHRDVQLQFARSNMPKAEKPAAAANNDEDEDDADNDGSPAPATKKRRRGTTADAVTINPGARRGNNRGKKKQPTAQPTASAASVSTNPSESIHSSSFAALASSNTAASTQPSSATGTAFTPINRPALSQPDGSLVPAPNAGSPVGAAPSTPSVDMNIGDPGQPETPDASGGDGSSQPTIYACHASADQQAAMDLLLSDMQAASKGLGDNLKFSGPLQKPSSRSGNQVPQTAAPGADQQALPSSQCWLPGQPQQAQPARQYFHHPNQPPPDYATSQRTSGGFGQGNPRRDDPLPQVNQQHQMQSTRLSAAQSPHRRQASPQNELREGGIQGRGNIHREQGQTSVQREGQVVHFQKHGRISHGPMAAMRQTNSGPGAVSIYNYYQPPTPSPLAIPANGNDQAPDNYFSWNSSQNLGDDQDALNGGPSTSASAQGISSLKFLTVDQKVERQNQDDSSLSHLHPSNWSLSAALARMATDDKSGDLNTSNPFGPIPRPDVDEVASIPGINSDEDNYQMRVLMGLAPPRAGDVYEEDIRTMFRTPSPREESSADEVGEESDDEVEESSDDEVKEEADVKLEHEGDFMDGS